MPLAEGDVEGDGGAAGRKLYGFGEMPEVVVEVLNQAAAQADHCFGGFPVPMDWQWAARFDSIQHSLRLVCGGVAEVEIHPQPGRGLRLGGQIVKDRL